MQTDYVYDGAIIELPIILDYENAKNLLIFTGHNSFLLFKDAFEKKLMFIYEQLQKKHRETKGIPVHRQRRPGAGAAVH